MRARAGDPPRTMSQKILAGRADDPSLGGDLVRVRVDQVVLVRDPNRALAEAEQLGMKRPAVEVAIAYDTRCVTAAENTNFSPVSTHALEQGVLLARPGIGFPAAVHLERFGSPARLVLTDEPRLSSVGGAGALTLCVPPSQLAEALAAGSALVRPARSVQVLLSGRVRPFVCVRDVALELVRRGLGDVVRRIDREYGSPVVIEFSGPSARLLSVPDRAVLCALAPQLGAAAALFVSDEKTEVYLRDQRRSKAHRGLVPDAGAPCDDVLTVDLSAVDPLVMDEEGQVRPVRELSGKSVAQVVLGGDAGTSLRDLLAAAALLKSKRVPSTVELLFSPPSRQTLEVLAQSGALVDLIATGARLIEPDLRVLSGELYPPPCSPEAGVSVRTFDAEPSLGGRGKFIVASAETLAYSVATGEVGDPRGFKRPVRVTVPRSLPTDDVLIVRKFKPKDKTANGNGAPSLTAPPEPRAWKHSASLTVFQQRVEPTEPSALVLESLDDLRWAARRAPRWTGKLRAVIAPHIPSSMVSSFSALGIMALSAGAEEFRTLRTQSQLQLPAPGQCNGENEVGVTAGDTTMSLRWLAVGAEREWTEAGTAHKAEAGS